MATSLQYPDAFLRALCNADREERAQIDVDALGTFSEYWRDKLTILRCYVIACMESQASPDDLFTAKLATYRKEFDATLAQARADTPNAQGLTLPMYSIPLERA